jgi:hypothetical protein
MVQEIFILSKRFFGISTLFNQAMADGTFELLCNTKTGVLDFETELARSTKLFNALCSRIN